MPLPAHRELFALVVEDREADFELITHELRRAGFKLRCVHVETEAEYLAQLDAGPDIILSDYALPGFDALRALELGQERGLDIPFIVLTGAVSEETVVECMKRGASDYLLKDRLSRLGPAVERALRECKLRSQKRQADAALVESNLRFQSLAETTKVIPWVLDLETWRFVYVGPQAASLLGYPLEEWYGEGFWEAHVDAEDKDALLQLRGNCGASPRDHDFECRMRSSAGETVHLRCIVKTSTSDNRTSISRGFMLDITELKKTQQTQAAQAEALQTATRAKSDFLARMSHEIRTPMNAILGMADLLWETELDDDQRQYVAAFRRAGGNLLMLINDILDLSKIEAGRIDLESSEFDLDELVAANLDLMRVRADDKGLDIVCEFSPEIHRMLRGDPGRLRQVLINLLGNAIKFTEAGQVTLRVDRELSEAGGFQTLRFSVSDTGPGIPLDKQAAIFETFTQADGSISRQYGGSGLGLTISRQIVERMGGRLEVFSIPGKGSTFSFAVPFELAAGRVSRTDAAVGVPSGTPLTGLRILLAEDSPDNQLLICAYLKNTARALEIAEDGQSAVEKFAPGAFDLVLMDVQMPVIDGFRATRVIREREAREGARRTPILALSAHAMKEAFEQSRAAGCDAHLTKPIQKTTLLQAIAAYCKARDRICVTPAKEVEQLAPWYLDRRRSDVTALAAALEASDYNKIRIVAHDMKGSGAGYGFVAITKIGAAMEAAAKQGLGAEIGTELAALADYLDRVEIVPV